MTRVTGASWKSVHLIKSNNRGKTPLSCSSVIERGRDIVAPYAKAFIFTQPHPLTGASDVSIHPVQSL